MHARSASIALLLLFACASSKATAPSTGGGGGGGGDDPRERSNRASSILLDVLARYHPEFIGRLGILGHDTEVSDLKPGVVERFRSDATGVLAKLETLEQGEQDPIVRQDLSILKKATSDYARSADLEDRYLIPYQGLRKRIFVGVQSLLDESIPPERRKAALVRLTRYAGMEEGFEPIADLAIARTEEKLQDKDRLGPVRAEVEKDLADAAAYKTGIADLVAKFGDATWKEPLAKLEEQLDAYDAFVKREVLPRTRTDFRLPPELYRFKLERNGIDLAPLELAARAREAFAKTQAEMAELAAVIAKARGFDRADYRSVIGALKKEQLSSEVVSLYEKRQKEIEAIIREKKLVTLPNRAMKFRLATAAETAEQPAPHIDQRGLFSKDKRVQLAFVIPQTNGGLTYDDFMFDAASWTLLAHEGRPGHDLQLSIIAERGTSLARTLFAFNSTNVEGWALYAEAIMRPFMPPEGRLISLQLLLLREARAFLDPDLQTGKISIEEARHVLADDVCMSAAMTKQELDRYTFDNPAQAPSYFYGYTRMLHLRSEVEKARAQKFDALELHDKVLSQGLLPPDLLEAAVLDRSSSSSIEAN